MRRAAQASIRGIYFEDEFVCGLTCSTWIMITTDTFMIGALGSTFMSWPDGLPTGDQENCVVEIVRLLVDELRRASSDGKSQ